MEMKLIRYVPFGIAGTSILLWFVAQACIVRHCLFYDTARMIGLPILLPLGIYAAFAIVPAFVAARSMRPVFMNWLWFAIGWSGISTLATAFTPVQTNPFFTMLPLTRNMVAFVAGSLFALISLALIVRSKTKD